MKTAVVLTGLLAALAISAQAITITDVTITGATNASGSITIVATIAGAGDEAMASVDIKSTDGLVCQLFRSTSITGTTWTNTLWTPYFTGEFIVTVTAFSPGAAPATHFTTVTVARTISGVINSVKVASGTTYDPNGPWTDINTSQVTLHNIGLNEDAGGAASVGCNMLNANPDITPDMTEEQQDIAYADIAEYAQAGTPFRFDMFLHKRPTSIMGFGEIKHFVWTPDSTNAPAERGRLVLDVTSCSPWRNDYTTNFQAHVGFAPLFMSDPEDAEEMEGILMCTSAHYMDVGPTNNTEDARTGLQVNGHSNTTSYLKMFIPDTQLPNFGVTNVDMATNMLMGYVTHFTSDGSSEEDTAAVTPEFTRIEGGTNIVYDYDADGVGDSGFEARFTFIFHSPVGAEMGPVGETPDSGVSWVAGDFDGDRLADPTLYTAAEGMWHFFLSTGNYSPIEITDFGGTGWTPTAGDFDGDGLADPGIYNAASSTLTVQLSASSYAQASVTGLGGDGYHTIQGDFDGDSKADPAVFQISSGTFAVKLSGSSYALATVTGFGGSGYTQVNGDYDGDSKADLAVYHAANGKWYFKLSATGYLIYDIANFGSTNNTSVVGDFDGDGKADPAIYRASSGLWAFKLSSAEYLIYTLSNLGGTSSTAVSGDFDGDGKADPAVISTAGLLSVKLSASGYATVTMQLMQ